MVGSNVELHPTGRVKVHSISRVECSETEKFSGVENMGSNVDFKYHKTFN